MKNVFSLIDTASLLKRMVTKKQWMNLILKMLIYGFCFGCVICQGQFCFQKYFSFPVGADIEIVDTKRVPISISFCKVVQSPFQNIGGRLFRERLTHLKALRVFTKNSTIDMFNETESALFEFIVSMTKPYACKEFQLPNETVTSVKVTHDAQSKKKNFHLFLHPSGMIQSPEFVQQYDNQYFHDYVDGNTIVKFETYDLTSSPKVQCKSLDFHACKTKRIIEEFNATIGCTYPIHM